MKKSQTKPAPKISVQIMRPSKPAGVGMGMTGKSKSHVAISNLGKYAHPAKKKR